MSEEQWSYKTIGLEQTRAVIEAYKKVQSCLKVSLCEGVFVSSATVSRLINEAVIVGFVDEGLKRGVGRPKTKRERAREIVVNFPIERGYKRREQASIAECSESTIYEAVNELVLSE